MGNLTKEQKRIKFDALKDFWAPVFEELGVNYAYFYPKPLMKWNGKETVWMLESEMDGREVFLEIASDFDMTVLQPRKLYKFMAVPGTEGEYEKKDTSIGLQYKIPVEELIPVRVPELFGAPKLSTANLPSPTLTEQPKVVFGPPPVTKFDEPEEEKDGHVNDLTARDWACIHLRVPGSSKKWLNELINKSKQS